MADPKHDGRFGAGFDDEISISGIIWSGVSILLVCILGMGITYWMWRTDFGAVEERAVSPLAEATVRKAPSGPLLQAEPEVELAEMRAEMQAHLEETAWVDPEAGIVRIPIDRAMNALVARGVETEITSSVRPSPEPPEMEQATVRRDVEEAGADHG